MDQMSQGVEGGMKTLMVQYGGVTTLEADAKLLMQTTYAKRDMLAKANNTIMLCMIHELLWRLLNKEILLRYAIKL